MRDIDHAIHFSYWLGDPVGDSPYATLTHERSISSGLRVSRGTPPRRQHRLLVRIPNHASRNVSGRGAEALPRRSLHGHAEVEPVNPVDLVEARSPKLDIRPYVAIVPLTGLVFVADVADPSRNRQARQVVGPHCHVQPVSPASRLTSTCVGGGRRLPQSGL